MDSVPFVHDQAAAPVTRLRLLMPLTLLVIGAAGMVLSYQLRLGNLAAPEPGLWPFLTFSAVALTAILIVPTDRAGDYERWDRRTPRVLAGIGVLIGFILLFEPIGFLIPATVMAVVWMRLFGRESWATSLALAAIGCVGLFLLFDRGLGVPFPEGPEAILLDQIGI